MKVAVEVDIPTREYKCLARKKVVMVLDRSRQSLLHELPAEVVLANFGIQEARPDWVFLVTHKEWFFDWCFCKECWPVVQDKLREVFGV